MKKILFIIAASLMPVALSAQSAIDAYAMSQTDFRGTARFMAMGGAFGALGGDVTSMNQNPAGTVSYTHLRAHET